MRKNARHELLWAVGLLAIMGVVLAVGRQLARDPARAMDDYTVKAAPLVNRRDGVSYQDLRVGGGAEVQRDDVLTVEYTEFSTASSSPGEKKRAILRLGEGQVLEDRVWDEGFHAMRAGGHRLIMGTGRGARPMELDVELLRVEHPAPKARAS